MNNFFVSRPIFAISLATVIVLLGIISIFDLSIEQYPDITPPVVEVSASYQGADAETVNNAVATPLAQSIMGVSDMLYMQATSANDGSMTLQVTFDIGTDPDMNAVLVQNNIATATSELPQAVIEQGVTTRKTQTGFLMVYALHSDGRYDGEFLSNYAYINLRNRLLKIDGVGKVSIMGADEYAMRIWLRPDVLNYYNISVEEVISAISVQGGIYPAGQFGAEPAPKGTSHTYTVTMPAQFSTPEEFSSIILKTASDGSQIRLSEVADVAFGSQSYGTSSLFDNLPTTVLVVYQEPGSNAVGVGKAVKAEMERAAEKFPDGVDYTAIVDSTESIRAGIEEIIFTLILALILVIFIIYLFIQDWRATLIPLVAIPVSIIGTFAVFPLLGFSINIISLLGLVLAIGLVVDDAIVVVEAVQVNIEKGMSPREATIEAMRNVTSPIIATSVVLLTVFVPVSFSGGITGSLFQQFAVTISVSVIFSTINALTLSPALCAKLLQPRTPATKGFFGGFNRLFERFATRYISSTEGIVRRTKTTALSVVVMGAVILAVWWALPSGFLPDEDQGYLSVFLQTPEASSLQVTEQVAGEVDAVIKRHPEVASTAVVSGFDMISGVAATNCGVIFVKLTDFSDRRLSAMRLADILTEELYTAIPNAECFAFVQPSIPGLGVTSGVTFALQDTEGRGSKYLSAYADRLIDSLQSSPLIASATTRFDDNVPQRHLKIDREQAMMKGVPLNELYEETAALLGSRYINNFSKFGRLYQTYLQAAPEYRRSESSLDSYFVNSADGTSIPLSTFVSVRDTVGVGFVSQFNMYRSVDITVTPQQKVSSGSVISLIEQKADEVLPDDISYAWSGVSALEESEASSGGWVYIIALAFVFLTLAALYESWTMPIAIVLAVPLAVAGAVGMIWLVHLISPTFINDIYMQISIVMLIGLAAKNSILVVEYADRLLFEQRMSLYDATIEAARLRMRPILMTAFAFILGIMPLVFANGVYYTARNIMGTALLGGMLAATLAGIFLYPALYYLVARVSGYDKLNKD
ncbi:MAG: efflux RND transporter permease subunit [Alistipes sp.]|nr:efflux RND transporter permease subunit [Alistipes sp.]